MWRLGSCGADEKGSPGRKPNPDMLGSANPVVHSREWGTQKGAQKQARWFCSESTRWVADSALESRLLELRQGVRRIGLGAGWRARVLWPADISELWQVGRVWHTSGTAIIPALASAFPLPSVPSSWEDEYILDGSRHQIEMDSADIYFFYTFFTHDSCCWRLRVFFNTLLTS